MHLRQDGGVLREQIWRHGRPWTALIIGAPAGLLFGLFQFGSSGGLERALFGGSSFGVFCGAVMSSLIWGRWKAAKKLSSQDRRAVARSVLQGEPIEDSRLAPAVIEYAEVVRGGHDRERRYRWTLWIWPTLTLALALAATVNGSTRQAVLFWGLVVFWIAFMPTQERRARKDRLARILRREFRKAAPRRLVRRRLGYPFARRPGLQRREQTRRIAAITREAEQLKPELGDLVLTQRPELLVEAGCRPLSACRDWKPRSNPGRLHALG